MTRKPFDPAAYARNDGLAREALREFLDARGVLTVSRETYGADIVAYHPARHEVEVKEIWTGPWPLEWPTVHIPERKKRLLQPGERLYFWIFNHDASEAWIIDGRSLTEEMLIEVPNSQVAKGERFYDVPVAKATHVRLKRKENQCPKA
jgi:hypothetical protein